MELKHTLSDIPIGLQIGSRVRIDKKHWARARQTGVIIEFLENGRLVIEFEREGIGFDGGKKLALGQEDLESSHNNG